MTRVVMIEQEPAAKCELCGNVSELRPYGQNRERICFACGAKDPEMTAMRFRSDVLGAVAKKPN